MEKCSSWNTGQHLYSKMFVVEHFRVGEPYRASRFEGHYRVWRLRGDDLYDALPVIFAELPQSRKREQLEEWAKKYGFGNRKKAVPEDPELDYG